MKKLIATAAFGLLALVGHAQEKKHQVHWNIANTIALASVEFGYQYFIDEHQAIGADILINDTYNMAFGREAKDFDTNSYQLSYNYYTGEAQDEWIISPFIKIRSGEYQQYEGSPIIDMDSFILGAGVGYMWNLNDTFVFGPTASIGRNFSDKVNDEFSSGVEFHLGARIGFRF